MKVLVILIFGIGLWMAFPACIQAQQYPSAWQAQAEARARAWQRTQENLQNARAETQQRMREAWQRNQEAWQRTQDRFWSEFRQNQAALQRMEENRAKAHSTYDRVYRPGEKHWSDPTQAQKNMDRGEDWAQYGRFWLDYWTADKQLRQEAAERQRQAAAQRARNDARIMGRPNYSSQPRTDPIRQQLADDVLRGGRSREASEPGPVKQSLADDVLRGGRSREASEPGPVKQSLADDVLRGGRSSSERDSSRDRGRDRDTGRPEGNGGSSRDTRDWQDRVRDAMDKRP